MRTYLLQRLKKPTTFDNPFNFGGGYRHGGFKDEAWNIVNKICSFDYMGSAEFEFGALPKSFDSIYTYAKNQRILTDNIKIKNKEIYFICHVDNEEYTKNLIKSLSKKFGHKDRPFLKEYDAFLDVLEDKDKMGIVGWLDLDNDLMFFIDEEMFKNFEKLFTEYK